MPVRVHDRPEVVRTPEKYNEHDHSQANKNVQHKEALRLALGSILTPKRPYTPSSRSGTASPAHPASFTPSTPPCSIPGHGADAGRTDALLHPRNPFFPHTPSRLGHSESSDHSRSSSSPSSPASLQPAKSRESSPPLSPPLTLPEPAVSDRPETDQGQVYAVRAPKPVSAPQPWAVPAVSTPESTGSSGSGSGTPKAKFLQTLQSKSAWDALIHGSFS